MLLALVLPTATAAQNLFGDSGFSGQRGTYSALPYESVDPLSGNLIVSVADLALPGNNGLDLVVSRTYNSKFHRDFENGDLTVDERSAVGVGWRLHFGRVLHATSTTPGQTVIETPDGAGGPLYQTSAFPEGWITKGFLRYNKATHTAQLPNGLTYVFGHVSEASGPRGQVRAVTSVTDVYGNSLTYTYAGAPAPPGSISHITQTLGAGQQRDVHFDYDAAGALIRMVYDGREWFYDHDPAPGVPGHTVLRQVRPPAGLPWTYEYTVAGAGPELTALVAPGEGRVVFAYGTVSRRASSLIQSSRVVTSRTTSGYLIVGGTWTFQYDQGSNHDTTIVTTPCGVASYRYNGVGIAGNFAAWASGTLAERLVTDGGVTIEREQLSYLEGQQISGNAVAGVSGVWSDANVTNALLQQRQLTRGTQTWTTDFEYHTTDYNDYGQAWRTVETGDAGTRITTLTFQYGFTPWIPGRVASSNVQVGSEGASSSTSYNLATGFATSTTVGNVTTTFAPNAQGNVASATDWHGHATSFTYSWGVAATTTTPLLSTSRTINPDGTIASETIGAGPQAQTTTFAYDLVGRLTRERRPGYPAQSTEILYRYFDPGNLHHWTTVERGARQTTTRVDGFGRAYLTTDFTNVIVRTERDACGRPTFTTLPYTTGTPETGTTTTYDALGRPKTVTDPGGTVTATYSYPDGDTWVTDAGSQLTKYDYAGFGGPGERLLGVTDAANQITSYQYDVLNNLTRATGPTVSGPVRTWSYDAGGRLLNTTQPESGTTTHQYDPAGRLSETTDALGQVTTYGYDGIDRLLTRNAPGTWSDVALEYDTVGRVSRQTIGSLTVGATGTDIVSTTFTFDTAGRPASRADAVAPGQTFLSSYAYDPHDNLTSITYPSGRLVGYSYDATKEDRLIGVTNNGVSFASNFHYDARGRLDELYTGPVRQAVTFDSRSRVSGISAGPAGLPQLALTYSYNTLSQVTGIADPRPSMSQTFEYDALDRLRVALGPWGTLQWTYDAQGNRTTEQRAGATTGYIYAPATQRLAATTGANPETFGYSAVGELTSDALGTYAYTPAGMMRTATRPGLSAQYLYDADHLRVRRDVNGTSQFTVRSVGGQVLSEFQLRPGQPREWVRDNLYAGSRLLGAVKSAAAVAAPRVELTAAALSATEGGPATATVQLKTGGAALATALSATVLTVVAGAAPATPTADFTPVTQTVTFPAGAAHNATLNVTLPTTHDTMDEPLETYRVELSAGPSAQLGAIAAATVTITDNDDPPTVSIGNVTVNEAAGLATLTVSLSQPSGFTTQVNYATANGTALACTGGGAENAHLCDYTATAGTRVIPAGTPSMAIDVPLQNNTWAEQHEAFTVTLSAPVSATLGTSVGTATIVDDEARLPIDTALPSIYFADVHSSPAEWGYLPIYNPHTVAVQVQAVFTWPNGTGGALSWTVPPQARIEVSLQAMLGPDQLGDMSVVVQSLDPARPVVAEHSSYSDPTTFKAGRNTAGTSPLSPTWYLAEGAANTYFDEYLTFYNPQSQPVDVTVAFQPQAGAEVIRTYRIYEGPGRHRIRVRDEVGDINEHATAITARTVAGALVPIAVERTIFWGPDKRESASAAGAPAPALTWYLPEGGKGGWTTYVLLGNPNATATAVRVFYYHENGQVYSQDFSIPAKGRVTAATPAAVPAGSFAILVGSLYGGTYVAERAMYDATTFELGSAETGQTVPAPRWRFADGAVSGFWDVYFVIMNNDWYNAVPVTLTYRRADGTTVTQNVTVPPHGRVAANPASVMGGSVVYATDVQSTNGATIVVERAMYWPHVPGWIGSHVSAGRPQ